MTSFKINNTIIFDANAQMSATSFEVDSDVGSIGVWGSEFQGTVAGYTSGGAVNNIDKFSFGSDGNATDVGDLLLFLSDPASQSSSTHGYTSGGFANPTPAPPNIQNVIQRFPFASNANATDVGDLTVVRYAAMGQSSSTEGYTSGGYFFPTPVHLNTIDKFPFATNANATDVGDITQIRSFGAGQSSSTHGYTSGGSNTPGLSNVIDRFPFATNANASDVGDLTVARAGNRPAGQSSSSDGYTSGGSTPNLSNIIDKFPFASNANATDVGDLLLTVGGVAGQSSVNSGYTTGGQIPTASSNVIQKFPFAANANATDVGDLTRAHSSVSGHQD